MIRIVLIFFAVFVTSCIGPKVDQLEYFKAKGYLAHISTFDLKIINSDYIGSGKPIRRPVHTWQPLLRIVFLGNNAKNIREHCLFYKIPGKEDSSRGILKFIEVLKDERCDPGLSRKSFIELEDIRDLKVYYARDREVKLPAFKLKVLKYGLALNFNYFGSGKGEEKWIVFPFMNLSRAGEAYSEERYGPSMIIRADPGVLYWPVDIGFEEGPSNPPVKMLGSVNDTLATDTLVKCHDVDDNCNETVEFKCDRCRHGWFEVISSKCEKIFTKYCGPNNCGEKGEPACIRGRNFGNLSYPAGCFFGGPTGYCKKGLESKCSADNVMICQ